ncbi:MAG: GNAT family N-acetyltransferase [Alicyclobacillus sp.]|nr:GNAT family N-acetyltransferase [Alicyclobacillus sp.]
MNWYERLAEHFPAHEMKSKAQMEDLIAHHQHYHVHTTDNVVVAYAEFPDFIFIDYLLVNPNTRGKGIGSRVLEAFKRKGKTIVVEVEPPDAEDQNTLRRKRFYEKNGFRPAEHIEYTRADDDGTPYTMDVYYWSPDEVHEWEILRNMATVCREIHNFRALKHYGRVVADPDESLTWLQ